MNDKIRKEIHNEHDWLIERSCTIEHNESVDKIIRLTEMATAKSILNKLKRSSSLDEFKTWLQSKVGEE